MPKYRILYKDWADEGKFVDVESESLSAAIWYVAKTYDSPPNSFVEVLSGLDSDRPYIVKPSLDRFIPE